jgi:hypothetical protein
MVTIFLLTSDSFVPPVCCCSGFFFPSSALGRKESSFDELAEELLDEDEEELVDDVEEERLSVEESDEEELTELADTLRCRCLLPTASNSERTLKNIEFHLAINRLELDRIIF